MFATLRTKQIRTLDEVRAFLEGSEPVDFTLRDRDSVYLLVRRSLEMHRYHRLGKRDKGLFKAYLAKVAGLSRAQLSRLIAQHKRTGHIRDRRRKPPANAFLPALHARGRRPPGRRIARRLRMRHMGILGEPRMNSALACNEMANTRCIAGGRLWKGCMDAPHDPWLVAGHSRFLFILSLNRANSAMMDEEAAPLSSFADGCEVVVCDLVCDAACRLREVGLREGAMISVLRNNGNVIVRTAGCRIGLRKELAMSILAKQARR